MDLLSELLKRKKKIGNNDHIAGVISVCSRLKPLMALLEKEFRQSIQDSAVFPWPVE